jgi:glycosyltransferase involved in cell wall biosynthesis
MSLAYSVIIPAWNESENILQAIKATIKAFEEFHKPYEILVIDDGSTDDTAKKTKKIAQTHHQVHLISHTHNQGKGKAIQTGMQQAQGKIRLFLDCDLSVSPRTFARMIPLFEESDIVIGSRRIPGAQITTPQPWYRTFSGRIFNLLVRLRTGLPYRDTQCGFKAFHARTEPIFKHLKTSGWVFDVELLTQAKNKKYRIAEIPVDWRNGKTSRLKLRDAWKIWKELNAIC